MAAPQQTPSHELLAALIDSLKDPFLFVDTGHIIRYMNKAALVHFRDGAGLLNQSLLNCHNERSRSIILATMAAFAAGDEEERLISDNDRNRLYMRAVRDNQGRLLGYYERYEPPRHPLARPLQAEELP
ncbi:MAG: hypothetical protein JXO49_01225 [Deltaproteobacteria bacterium]|nr:hypothetical protein [Candidatus Anaeroferrophillus wilburensis]MBN2887948.1 hypothetical protein [Deltaproteobacteria bacterium]